MNKKSLLNILFFSIFLTFVFAFNTFAFEDAGLGIIEPNVDVDLVVMQNNQSKTVTADLNSSLDFEAIPVLLYGNGNFSMSLSRTNTSGEIIYLAFYGFGVPTADINIGVTPVTLRLSSSISEHDSRKMGLIVHGILFSLEDPPYEYNVTLSY